MPCRPFQFDSLLKTIYNFYRCTNSDPNYGTTWFHFRSKPYDTPNTVLRTALFLMTFEVSSAQQLYVRAVTRYVQRCLQKNVSDSKLIIADMKARKCTIENMTSKMEVKCHEVENIEETGRGDLEVGNITVPFVVSDREGDDIIQDNREVGIAEGIRGAVTSHECASAAGLQPALITHCPALLESQATSLTNNCDAPLLFSLQEEAAVVDQREAELIEDFNTILSHQRIQKVESNRSVRGPGKNLFNDGGQCSEAEAECDKGVDGVTKIMAECWPIGFDAEMVPLAIFGGGSVYCSPDFVTASIEMNRAMFNRHLNQEEKRKVLFGSDQIIP